MMLLAAMLAMLIMTAAPAMADVGVDDVDVDDVDVDGFEEDGSFISIGGFDDEFFDEEFFDDEFFDDEFFDDEFFDDEFFDEEFFDDEFDNAGVIAQESEFEVESGEAEQEFEIVGGGDNSNQCLGLQGIVNTGNAVFDAGILQFANEEAEAEIEDAGNFVIDPELAVECAQEVNQAAAASAF